MPQRPSVNRLLLALAPLLLAASLQAKPLATPAPTPAPTPAATPQDADLSSLAVGVGYPDVRLRLGFGDGWNAEAKGAFGEGLQIYSGRLYWDFAKVGPLLAMAGAEAGVAEFANVDSVTGSGFYGEAFVGLEYPFAHRLRLSVDAGPARLQAASGGQTYASTDVIFNTALYFYFF